MSRARTLGARMTKQVRDMEDGKPAIRRYVGAHLHAIQSEQIAALEECFATRKLTGWVIPPWLQYLKSVSPMRMPVKPLRDVTELDG